MHCSSVTIAVPLHVFQEERDGRRWLHKHYEMQCNVYETPNRDKILCDL